MSTVKQLISDYRDWILSHEDPLYNVIETHNSHDSIEFITSYATAEVSFTEDIYEIVELRITDRIHEETKFYLHFEMNDLNHAKELFEEMLHCLYDMRNDTKTKVLLCCSSALTTSYFAEKLNEAAEAIGFDCSFSAVSYNNVFEKAYENDIVLLAPQVSYLYPRACEIMKDKTILKVPPAVYATYDASGIVTLVREALNKKRNSSYADFRPAVQTGHDGKILVIVAITEFRRVRIIYRVYENDSILFENTIMKATYAVRDLEDIADVITTKYGHIDMISICTPGVLYNGRLTFKMYGIYDEDVENLFADKYGVPCSFCNDANAMALGYYISQNKYQNITFYFHPHASRKSGVGNIINGKLHTGHSNIAGEMQYLADSLKFSAKPEELVWTPEGAIELLSRYLIAIISCTDPEAIVISCDMIPDPEELKNSLSCTFREDFIPDLIKVDDVMEYMFAGAIKIGYEQLQEQ